MARLHRSIRPAGPRHAPMRRAAAVALALLLGACASPAPSTAPTAPVSAAWKNAPPPGWISTADAPKDWQQGRWWALFDDADLDALMGRVEIGNPNLALALANVAQAEALLRQAQAQQWPTLGVQLGAQRGGRPTSGAGSLQGAASWAPDLWGRLADAVQAQGAKVQASQADLASARLAAQGGNGVPIVINSKFIRCVPPFSLLFWINNGGSQPQPPGSSACTHAGISGIIRCK